LNPGEEPRIRAVDPLPPEPQQRPELLFQQDGPYASLLIVGAHVLDPGAGVDEVADVLVTDGRVQRIGPTLEAPEGVERIDAAGLHLFPGFTDPHVHLRIPGQAHKETIETGTRAAAAGGFVQLIAMANTSPPVDSVPALRSLQARAASEAVVPTAFTATATRGMSGSELTDMASLAQAGAAAFTDDGMPIADAGVLRRALQYQAISDRIIALHEEDHALSAGGSMHAGLVSARLGIGGIPSTSESSMIARDVLIADGENRPIHIQHLSAAESVDVIRSAKAQGVSVTCEASPHHLALTDAAVGDGSDARFKMNPPLRAERDRQALIEGLKDGTIDCIATDHAPHAEHEKDEPFEEAPFGVTGLETAFAAVYTELVDTGLIELALAVDKLTAGCAIFGLPRPRVAEGEIANLCLADLGAEWLVGDDGYHSRSGNSCFDGRRLKGRVLLTLAGGRDVHRARSFALQEVRS
jgi:dihydroorotase